MGEDTIQDAIRKQLDHLFTRHVLTVEQSKRCEEIFAAAKIFAETVLLNAPKGADQSAALRKIREATMTANMAVALEIATHDVAGQQGPAALAQ